MLKKSFLFKNWRKKCHSYISQVQISFNIYSLKSKFVSKTISKRYSLLDIKLAIFSNFTLVDIEIKWLQDKTLGVPSAILRSTKYTYDKFILLKYSIILKNITCGCIENVHMWNGLSNKRHLLIIFSVWPLCSQCLVK